MVFERTAAVGRASATRRKPPARSRGRSAASSRSSAAISADGAATGRVKPFVEEVDPTSRFADDGGKLVVYAIIAAAKGGVFLADVP
jgi:hypothetical protein